MKARVDRERCEGFGICADHAPDVFELDEWGYAAERGDGTISLESVDRARRAAVDCPLHAIQLSE